jgi:glycosyltransferase involved in cell wall biosynthesis
VSPQFSIITPSFRQFEWLKTCAASVTDQEGATVEHIVQDAGTGPELEGWAAQQSGLKLYVEKDAGMYDAINRGLQHASGEIAAYLNCDEQYLPGALHKVADYFSSHPEIEVVFGDAILVDAEGVPLSYRRAILPSISHLRLADLNTLSCATFFRRSVFEAGHHFPTHLKIAGDQYWVFQLLKAGIKMGVMPQPLSVFTFTGANLSHSGPAHLERFGWLPTQEKRHWWMRPALVFWHRVKKLSAGAYKYRTVAIELYKKGDAERRHQVCRRIGFRWPKIGHYAKA